MSAIMSPFGLKTARRQQQWLISGVILFVFALLYFPPFSTSSTPTSPIVSISVTSSVLSPSSGPLVSLGQPLSTGFNERITLVVVWAGLTKPAYLSMFLRSVEANSERVDLVFVAKQDPESGKCVDLGKVERNIVEACLSNEEYWSLHVDYLEQSWGGLKPEEKEKLKEKILQRGLDDYIHSHFRILRGSIFKKYAPVDNSWWGWCDTDDILGNFDRQFPWDIAHQYDVVQPSHQTDAKEILVYMRGHLTLFQSRPTTTSRLLSFPAFRSYEAYMSSPMPASAMEEEDFSTFVFHHSPDLTFLLFDALVTGHFKAVTLAPHLMTLRLAEPFEPTLPLPNPAITPRPHTLSNKALIAEGVVKLERGVTKEAVWMPVEKMVSYVPLKSTLDGSRTRRFLMRNSPGGPVVERLEDWSRWELPGSQKEVYEGLYIHLQMEKKESWFKKLPLYPLQKGQLMELSGWEKCEIRKGREVVWTGTRDMAR